MKLLFALAASLLMLCLCLHIAMAQSTSATLSGIVVDASERIIVDADVTILNEATGTRYDASTNHSGIYTISILPPGEYRVQVTKPGFKTLIKPGIVLNVQSAVALNFTLPVGAASESVTIEAGTTTINTTDGSVSTVVDRQFVENMPLNGRSFQDLLTLAPGVAQVMTSVGVGAGVGYSGDIVVNGQRTESNYFTVDGVSANVGAISGGSNSAGVSGSLPAFTALGTTQGLASIDDLQEFRSNTSTYSAEYGRNPGGQFSFSTRSGTETLHGSVFEFLRNDAFDANNWFNDFYKYPKGKERQNDFGGTFGGPLAFTRHAFSKPRTFFFLSYEGLRLSSPQAVKQVEVPDSALRQQSPASLQPLLNAFPAVDGGEDGKNDGFGYYLEAVSYPSHLDSTSIRIDHSIGGRFNLFGRYSDSPSDSATYTAAVRQNTSNHTRSGTVGTTWALTNHQSNELRFNFTRSTSEQEATSTNLGGAKPFSLGSIPGPAGSAFPALNSDLYVVFDFAGYTNFSLSDFPHSQDQVNLTDAHDWTIGRHNLKAGVDWRRMRTILSTITPTEEIAFDSLTQVQTNTPDFGYVTTAGLANDNEPIYNNFSSFIEDEWKATTRLSLSLGVRWDINPAPTNANGPVPYTVTQVSDLSSTHVAPQGTPLWKTDWTGLAQRVGSAFQLRKRPDWQTVLRSGFGLFYDTGNSQGSGGYNGIGFASSASISNPSFPLSSAQLTLPAPSISAPYTGNVYGFDPHLPLPYSIEYTLALEQALGQHDTLTLNFVGSGDRHLLTLFHTYPATVGNPNFAASGSLVVTSGRASSNYDAFQAQYQRSVHQGIEALASYTYSHSIDNASSNFSLATLDRASSDFDIRHSFQAALTYTTPRSRTSPTIANLFGNWGLDLRIQARTAVPVDIIGRAAIDPVTGTYLEFRPNLVSGQAVYLYNGSYPGGRIFNYAAFLMPSNGAQGNLPRNFARAFPLSEIDTALRRDFTLFERLHTQLRAEAFNIANHPMFGTIYSNLAYGPSLFGRANNTANAIGNLNSIYQPGGPRSLQLALKLTF